MGSNQSQGEKKTENRRKNPQKNRKENRKVLGVEQCGHKTENTETKTSDYNNLPRNWTNRNTKVDIIILMAISIIISNQHVTHFTRKEEHTGK